MATVTILHERSDGQGSRHPPRNALVRHYLEMVLTMVLAMGVLGGAVSFVFALAAGPTCFTTWASGADQGEQHDHPHGGVEAATAVIGEMSFPCT